MRLYKREQREAKAVATPWQRFTNASDIYDAPKRAEARGIDTTTERYRVRLAHKNRQTTKRDKQSGPLPESQPKVLCPVRPHGSRFICHRGLRFNELIGFRFWSVMRCQGFLWSSLW
jgi:hypothetical protein